MASRDFASIETALQAVGVSAARLPAGDAAGHVRRSVDELRVAFLTRAAIEPAVDRVLGSLRMLQAADRDGHRRDHQREAPRIDRLLRAVRMQLLPVLRRFGFEV
jgi:hypothetical protein